MLTVIRSEVAELAEGLAATTENNSSAAAVNPGDVLGIMKMEMSDFGGALSGLEVKVERLGAAFDEILSTADNSLVSYERLQAPAGLS